MSRSGGTQVQTQSSEPYGPQAAHLSDIFARARSLYGTGGPSYYPGRTHVPFASETNEALTGIASRARGGNSLNANAMGLAKDTIAGKYLSGSPYLDAVYTTVRSAHACCGRSSPAGAISGRPRACGSRTSAGTARTPPSCRTSRWPVPTPTTRCCCRCSTRFRKGTTASSSTSRHCSDGCSAGCVAQDLPPRQDSNEAWPRA